jgi:hypothetical protein
LLLVGPLLLSSHAMAGQVEDLTTRMDALQRENSAIRRENAALLENKRLRERNAGLKSSAAQASPAISTGTIKPSVYNAMAADLAVAYKAPPPESPGRFQIWAEGGAIWSGGDPVTQTANLTNFTGLGIIGGGGGSGSIPHTFSLTPKVGWEAATGFDYRFANSPWHISGQFRYGEGGKTDGSANSAGVVDPALLAALGNGGFAGGSVGGSEALSTSYKETHWLADLAVGREIAGSGRDALQLKGGLRVAEFVTQTNTSDNSNLFFNFPAPINIGGGLPPVSSLSTTTNTQTNTRASFLGAGPLIGVQGSVPFAGNWSFDYLGDAAILFGTQQSNSIVTTGTTVTPAALAFLGGGNVSTTTAERFAYVLSADIQAGVSYWFTPNLKVGASYRLDALINVQNTARATAANIMPDRYTHGPRLTVTGQF